MRFYSFRNNENILIPAVMGGQAGRRVGLQIADADLHEKKNAGLNQLHTLSCYCCVFRK